MKQRLFKISPIKLTVLFLLCSLNVFSQKPITWKGGTPGMENEWNCPQNWSTSSVPDEFSDVIIPDVSTSSFSLPIIRSGEIEVNSLFIDSNSSITIAKAATIMVYDETAGSNLNALHGEGTLVFYEGTSSTAESFLLAQKGH